MKKQKRPKLYAPSEVLRSLKLLLKDAQLKHDFSLVRTYAASVERLEILCGPKRLPKP